MLFQTNRSNQEGMDNKTETVNSMIPGSQNTAVVVGGEGEAVGTDDGLDTTISGQIQLASNNEDVEAEVIILEEITASKPVENEGVLELKENVESLPVLGNNLEETAVDCALEDSQEKVEVVNQEGILENIVPTATVPTQEVERQEMMEETSGVIDVVEIGSDMEGECSDIPKQDLLQGARSSETYHPSMMTEESGEGSAGEIFIKVEQPEHVKMEDPNEMQVSGEIRDVVIKTEIEEQDVKVENGPSDGYFVRRYSRRNIKIKEEVEQKPIVPSPIGKVHYVHRFPDPRKRIKDPELLKKVHEFLEDIGTNPDDINFKDSYTGEQNIVYYEPKSTDEMLPASELTFEDLDNAVIQNSVNMKLFSR